MWVKYVSIEVSPVDMFDIVFFADPDIYPACSQKTILKSIFAIEMVGILFVASYVQLVVDREVAALVTLQLRACTTSSTHTWRCRDMDVLVFSSHVFMFLWSRPGSCKRQVLVHAQAQAVLLLLVLAQGS